MKSRTSIASRLVEHLSDQVRRFRGPSIRLGQSKWHDATDKWEETRQNIRRGAADAKERRWEPLSPGAKQGVLACVAVLCIGGTVWAVLALRTRPPEPLTQQESEEVDRVKKAMRVRNAGDAAEAIADEAEREARKQSQQAMPPAGNGALRPGGRK